MGGFQRSSDDSGGGRSGSGGSSTMAESLQARLSASQEASMRQLKEERDAACRQVEALVAAMDDATKAKGRLL